MPGKAAFCADTPVKFTKDVYKRQTIRSADRILVLDGEGISEEGTHEQLLARKGEYWRLWTGAQKLHEETI